MTTQERALEEILRYSLVTVAELHPLIAEGRSVKATEAALAKLQAKGLVVSYPFLGRKKIYAPTAKAARIHGLNEKRFMRPPGHQAISDRLLVLQFCRSNSHQLMTRREFAEQFPEQAACEGISHLRYYVDKSQVQPTLSVIVPDYGANVRRILRKSRHAISKRKEHQAFRDLIFHNLLQVTVVTSFAMKARRLQEVLAREPFRHVVVVVPGLDGLLFSNRNES